MRGFKPHSRLAPAMTAPSHTDLEVIRRLAGTPEGRLLVSVLQSRLTDLDKRNRRVIGDELVRSQGRAIEIEEILTELLGVSEAQPAPLVPRQPKRPTLTPYVVNHMAVPND